MTAIEFLYGLPGKVYPSALEGHETTFHFDLSGEGGGQCTVSVSDGQLNVEQVLNGRATCTVSSSAQDFLDVVTGKSNPMMAVMTGKVRISNVSEMMKYARMFGLG
ncbi:MAG: SCP2 sterol-binding domain-containing protein [Saprospiraceae bacterium]|nr:SCP2 sterol-binding domain-containing protein [Saprospiraceae bacterium]